MKPTKVKILKKKNKSLNKKKVINIKKFVLINSQKYFYKSEKKEIEKIETENEPNNVSFNRLLYSNNYMKYIEKFVDKSKDQHIIKNMTKYLRDTFNIRPPKFHELVFLEETFNQIDKKKLNQFVEIEKKKSISDTKKQSFSPKNSNKTPNNYNISPIVQLNSPLLSPTNTIKFDFLKNYKKNSSKNTTNLATLTTLSNLNQSNLNLNEKTLKTKEIIIKQCTSFIKTNEKLINKNIQKHNKTDFKFKESFNKVFSGRDVVLEKDLVKDAIQNIKNQGEFIYGSQKGFYINNQSLLFNKI